jgi:hypothetical protein
MAARHPPLSARLSCRFTPVVAAVAFVTPRLAVALLSDGSSRKRSG